MAPVDVMLQASIVAATIITASSVVMQKYYRVYDLFIGKKYGILAHGALVVCAWLQVAAITVYAFFSEWRMPSLWPVGIPFIIAAVYLCVMAVKEIGLSSFVHASLFNGQMRVLGKTYQKYRHPVYLSICLLYIGVGFTTGRYGYLLAVGTLALCFSVLIHIERDRKSTVRKR